MNITCEVQNKEFAYLLDELRKQLLEVSVHFEIWEGLWPTEQVVDVINRYKGFFLPSRDAHLDRFIIKVCNVFSNESNQPSFYRIFSMIDKNATLAPDLNVRSLKKRLRKYNSTLRAIEDHRNKRSAHWDIGVQTQGKPILFGDCKQMLDELQNIFNEICNASTKNTWSFKPTQHGDTNSLLNHLNELMDIHKKRNNELKSITKF
jgi:hypothetical protein